MSSLYERDAQCASYESGFLVTKHFIAALPRATCWSHVQGGIYRIRRLPSVCSAVPSCHRSQRVTSRSPSNRTGWFYRRASRRRWLQARWSTLVSPAKGFKTKCFGYTYHCASSSAPSTSSRIWEAPSCGHGKFRRSSAEGKMK